MDIGNLKDELVKAETDKNQTLAKYYIPELSLYQKVVKNKTPE